jgi:hypothetical protein
MNNTPAGRVIPRMNGLGFGGDWNPEQWPQPSGTRTFGSCARRT